MAGIETIRYEIVQACFDDRPFCVRIPHRYVAGEFKQYLAAGAAGRTGRGGADRYGHDFCSAFGYRFENGRSLRADR